MLSGARHRAATNPMPLTSRNSALKMMISVMWSLIGSPPRHPVDDDGGRHAEQNEQELDPVERGEADETRRVVVVNGGQQRHDDRNEEQPVPRTAVGPLDALGGHRLGRF